MVNINGDTLRINLERKIDDSYDIIIGSDLFPQIAEDLAENYPGKKVAIYTDRNVVNAGHAGKLYLALEEKGIQAKVCEDPAGEQHKTFAACGLTLDDLTKDKFGRDSVILALGGGVIGDKGGFIAALLNRGVPYYQIPTTTLSQADSSVGGKTGVDNQYGKNLIGVFKQPSKVFIDVSTLATLPEKEYISGFAETVKHGIILDKEFFEYLEKNVDKIKKRDTETLIEIARKNCAMKGSVVEIDPEEKGLRRILNYAHTIGHAIEKEMNYSMQHGEAVAIAMNPEGKIAQSVTNFSRDDLRRQEFLLTDLGLPTKIPRNLTNEQLIAATMRDKKTESGKVRYCLPKEIGTMETFGNAYATEVSEELVTWALNSTR